MSLPLALFTIGFSFAQAPIEEGGLQLNAGIGTFGRVTPIYAGLDYGIAPNFTLGGELSYQSYNHGSNEFSNDFKSTIIGIQANGNYHFNEILDIPSVWDLYAGANLNYFSWSSKINGTKTDYNGADNFGLGLQIGGRYFFSDNMGVNIQFGGGNVVSGGKIGITYIF
ncbi:outer membrane beta-barrel protein [Mariniflexile fucanivorans]|uniref:outer membrane beta-barrel protein n=1 Tax=Mariniflexile fucanivorans TaxID=264023 RepID=UPI00104AB0D8|nr:outer membrane beta-barrel protein [Mariniflexile fucanivorans]